MVTALAGEGARRVASRIGVKGLLLALSYLWLLVAAVVPASAAFLVGVLASYAAEVFLGRWPGRDRLLDTYGLGVAQRFVLREAFAVVLLLRARLDATDAVAWLVCGVLGVQLARAAYRLLRARADRMRACRHAWRNITPEGLPAEWPQVRLPNLPVLGQDRVRTLLYADVPLVLGVPLVGLGLTPTVFGYLSVAALLLAALLPALVAVQLPKLRVLPDDPEVLTRLRAAVERRAPEVVVYFSGPRNSTYPLNVWLSTLAHSRRSTLVILGESHHLAELANTALPVVVLPSGEDVAALHLPSVRASLFPTNAVKNNHMLRLAGVRSSFIGHGDSDKAGSFNPLSRIYDEIWVAGEAGRARYARTREGIRPEQVEVIGRPQLVDIQRAAPSTAPGTGLVTVFYAPTWEGFFEESDYSSLLTMGEELVRRLLAMDPPIRVLFKRHPATGTRDRDCAAVASRIESLVGTAGGGSKVVDDTEGLYAGFNEAHLLVTDISSVATDFLYSGKPLVVTNPHNCDDASFVEEFPLTGAAYRIGPDCAGLEDTVRRAVASDPLREERLAMRTYLLGDTDIDPVNRFWEAVDRLVERNHYAPPTGGLRRLALLAEERGARESQAVRDGSVAGSAGEPAGTGQSGTDRAPAAAETEDERDRDVLDMQETWG